MSSERRRYFRIPDRALIKYRIIAEGALDEERRFIFLNEVRASNLHAALMGIELRLQDIFDAVRSDNKQVAEALELMNRKMTLIERVVALEGQGREHGVHAEHVPVDVNISGGGVALQAEQPLELDTMLAIDIILLPSNHPMRVIGRVVDSRQLTPGYFAIAIEFEDIREEDRDILIQHIVRKQSENLRVERDNAA